MSRDLQDCVLLSDCAKDQAPLMTLARKLGQPAHLSGLAIRLGRACDAPDHWPEWLLKVAGLKV